MKWVAEFWLAFCSLFFIGLALSMFVLWDSDAIGILYRLGVENRVGVLLLLSVIAGAYVGITSADESPPLVSLIRRLWPSRRTGGGK